MAIEIIEKHVVVGVFRADRRNRYTSGSWYGGKGGEKAHVVRIGDRLYFTTDEYAAFIAEEDYGYEVVLTPKILKACVEAALEGDETRTETNGYRFEKLNDTYLGFEAPCGATYRIPFEDIEIILQEFGD